MNTSGVRLVPLTSRDATEVLRIFNHYIADGFAAYPEKPATEDTIASLLGQAVGHPAISAVDTEGHLLGFGFLRPYFPHDTFAHTAQTTIFIASEQTGQGIGTAILHHLEEAARTMGITKILAHISSHNPGSLAFHAKHGFTECGRFPKIGRKWGKPFDVVWMIKHL